MKIKDVLSFAVAAVGGTISSLFGGWSATLTTLVVCMCIDYVSGLVVAAVFNNSPKSATGGAESRAGWKGLCRKALTLLFVLIGARVDIALETDYIRDAICLGFTANEILSIVENGGLMGIKYPAAVTNALELLQKKAGGEMKEHRRDDDE